jgi:hypothetical protein
MTTDNGGTSGEAVVGGPASAEEKARTPHKRDRKSHLKKSAPAADGAKGGKHNAAQDDAQERNADRVVAEKESRAQADKARLISTKLQTKEHVGKHPAEPDKHDEVEAAKVGLDEQLTGGEEIEVKTIDQEVDGKHVDTIAYVEGPEPPVIGGSHPLTEGQKVQAVLDKKFKKN